MEKISLISKLDANMLNNKLFWASIRNLFKIKVPEAAELSLGKQYPHIMKTVVKTWRKVQ